MSDAEQVTSGDTQPTSGSEEATLNAGSPEASTATTETTSDEATYPKHFVDKVMTEKKNATTKVHDLEAKVADYENKEKERHEDYLKKNKKWEDIAKLREVERDESNAKLSTMNERIEGATKFNALLDALPGTVEKQYLPLLEAQLKDIVVNPDTGEPDEVSVRQVADKVRETYGRIFDFGDGAKMPNGAPKPHKQVDFSQWDSFSVEDKKTHLKDFVNHKLQKR